MTMTIRAPRHNEAEVLADLHLRTWEETYGGILPASAWGSEAREQRLRMWTQLCSSPHPSTTFAVTEIDGRPVGFAGAGQPLEPMPASDLELYFIYLLRSAQGAGAGQALLNDVLGSRGAQLWVFEGNQRALRFYAKNGFVADGGRQGTGYPIEQQEIRLVR